MQVTQYSATPPNYFMIEMLVLDLKFSQFETKIHLPESKL